jgi:hypothetical protein
MRSSSVSTLRSRLKQLPFKRTFLTSNPTPFHYTDPQLKLYQNSQEIDQYTGDRSHSHLTEYVQDKSRVFARSLAQNVLVESGREKAASGVNAEGISVNAGEEQLDGMIKDGPVFVKFYAPWCGQ